MIIYHIKLQDDFIENFNEENGDWPFYREFVVIAHTIEQAMELCVKEETNIDDSNEHKDIWQMKNVICQMLGISKYEPQVIVAVPILFEG